MYKKLKIFLIVAFSLLFCSNLSIPYVFAVTETIETVDAQKDQLEAELSVLEKEIAEKEALLKKQKTQTGSIQKEISILTTQIEKAKLNIQAKSLTITKLKKEIEAKNKTIVGLEKQISDNQGYIGESIKKTSEVEMRSLVEMILSSENFSEFYIDIDTMAMLQISLQNNVEKIKKDKGTREKEKESLNKKQNAEADAKAELENTKKKTEKNEKEKNKLLGISKNQEQEYQKLIKEREKKAAEIRAALFALRDAKAIPFGDALTYAELASTKTGVRSALILAIIQQESNMGANVGTCNRSGDPPSKHWKVIMPGPTDKAKGDSKRDDQSAFLRITQELGIPQEGTPLSCPWGNGWGGAMGPSQFIPTTWELFKEKIGNALGIKTPDPWNPKHAIMATATYLSGLGAGQGGYTAERNAACRYYSGRDCDNKSPANTFYGDQVVSKANNIQNNMIDPLKNL